MITCSSELEIFDKIREESMTILTKSIYIINYEQNRIEHRDAPDDFNEYIENLLQYIDSNSSVREYKTRSQRTEVVSTVNSLIEVIIESGNNIDESSEDYFRMIARRLLRNEVETQASISRMGTNVKKGSLVQAVILDPDDNKYYYLITKVEHTNFIDDVDFTFKTGFASEDKKIWKSCVFQIEISDSGPEIFNGQIYLDGPAKYWHDSFLELTEALDDEANTTRSFKAIERVLTSIKKVSPPDYTVLRNSIVGYMKTPQHIDYNTMIETVLGNYEGDNIDQARVEGLKSRLLELPENRGFDRQFTSVPGAINARVRKVYKVNSGIELKIHDHINNISETIKSVEEPSGERFIKIRTNDEFTFRSFES